MNPNEKLSAWATPRNSRSIVATVELVLLNQPSAA
jgi:hypothetical protein